MSLLEVIIAAKNIFVELLDVNFVLHLEFYRKGISIQGLREGFKKKIATNLGFWLNLC